VYFAGRSLVDHTIEKSHVATDVIIERKSGGLEVVIAETLIEAAAFKFASYMSLNQRYELLEAHPFR
jgi:hypothetical protein